MSETIGHSSGQRLIFVFMGCALVAMFVFAINFRLQNPSLTHVVKRSSNPDQAKMMDMIGQLMEKLQKNPDDVSTLETLATVFMSLHEWERAKHFWQRLLKLDSDNAQAHQQLALVLFRIKEHDQAVKHLKEVLKFEPKNVYAHYNLAMIYTYYLDQEKKGQDYFQQILQLKGVEEQLRQKAQKELEAIQP